MEPRRARQLARCAIQGVAGFIVHRGFQGVTQGDFVLGREILEGRHFGLAGLFDAALCILHRQGKRPERRRDRFLEGVRQRLDLIV
ncbi:hypothetical protein A6P55_25915 (plasmid) [Pandoraea pnomenusa]|nr:hypothetical protein A6P55_25915 [Pandoraea pnomenusa]